MPLPPSNGQADRDFDALNGAPSPDERAGIGVVGGMGPAAGFDLVRWLFDETDAHTDQDHLPVAMLSYPGRIPDRTTWINDPDAPNPVPALLEILRRLDEAGCAVAGIPCNTAHAPVLYDALRDGLAAEGRAIERVHIVEAIVAHIQEIAPGARRIGVLATNSSLENRLHEKGLVTANMEAVRPEWWFQCEVVNPTIFDETYGIKAVSHPPTERAREDLLRGVEHLREQGAEAVILGCTELPLAIPETEIDGLPMINSTRALARALIRRTHPGKLRPVDEAAEVE